GTTVRELLGPRDLTMQEATRILGASIGRPDLEYVQFPYDDYAKALMHAGFSESVAQLFAEMAQAMNAGRVRSLEGRNAQNTTPTTLESWAQEVWAKAYETA
ncbi:MAG: FMN-dependent NADH-azoreductase, partial [Gemmatimonadota bacterium]